MTAPAAWRVDLTEPAEADFAAIIPWTAEQFGNAQARAYADVGGEFRSMPLRATSVGSRRSMVLMGEFRAQSEGETHGQGFG